MAITNTLYDITYEKVGQVATVYQRTDASRQSLWMALRMGNVSETDTTYTFTINGHFKYWGYQNIIFTELGYWICNTSGTIMSSNQQRPYVTTENNGAQMTSDGMWVRDCTWTITKTTYDSVLIPYFKIGMMSYYDAVTKGEAWWWGNGYGVLTAWGNTNNNNYIEINAAHNRYGIDATFNGKTRSLPAATVTVTKDTSHDMTYSNGLIFPKKKAPITVYDSSGKPHKASKITVYDSSGKPHVAKNITIYDSSGKPHTMPC